MAGFKNNGKLKLLIIVGTRPEIIRLAAVINKCREYFDCLLAHTGQNYDYNLNGVFFKDLKLADPDVYMEAVGSDLGETMGNIIAKSYQLMVEVKPDAVLVLGDTNSCLCAIAAKKRHIPIFHMEAGNRCFDQRVPEESNRKIVDHISDINLCYSSIAREYLLREGLPPDQVIKTGSPMLEVLTEQMPKVKRNTAKVLKAMGVSPLLRIRHAVLPQLMPALASAVLYRFDVNTREASVLGIVGAGGIGAPLVFAMNHYQWSTAGAISLGLILIVWLIDILSGRVRYKRTT